MFKPCSYFTRVWGHRSKQFGGRKSILSNLIAFRWSVLYSGEHTARKLAVRLGPGAGYIGGFTFYVAYRMKGTRGVEMYLTKTLQAGATRNATAIPFGFGY